MGIGTGLICEHLPGTVNVTGIDVSLGMLAQARSRQPAAELIHGDITAIQDLVPGRRFDVILARAVLGHVEIEPVVAKVSHFLSSGGVFIACEQVAADELDEQLHIEFNNLIHPGHVQFPTVQGFKDIVTRAGLGPEHCTIGRCRCSLSALLASLDSDQHRANQLLDSLNSIRGSAPDWEVETDGTHDTHFTRTWVLVSARRVAP
jgi:hypothetical protein